MFSADDGISWADDRLVCHYRSSSRTVFLLQLNRTYAGFFQLAQLKNDKNDHWWSMWCQKYFRASWLAQRSIWRHIWPGLSGPGSTPGIYHFNQFLIELFWKKFIKFTSYIRIFPWHSHGSEFLRLFNRDRAKKNRQFSYYAHVILRIEKPLKNIKTIISCSKNHPTCFLKLRFFSQIMILGNKH